MSEEKKTETSKDVADITKESYAKALETTAKLQEQYFENVKKATDYFTSLQKTWIDATGKMSTVTPDMLKGGVTSEAYRSIYDFWMKQFEALGRQVGMPMVAPFKGSVESVGEVSESFWKGFDIYSKSYATWIELERKNFEIVIQNLTELQKAMLGTYKGLMPLFSVPEEQRTKIFDWMTESFKKSLEATTDVINKQLETLAKLVQDLSSNIEKLTNAMRARTITATT